MSNPIAVKFDQVQQTVLELLQSLAESGGFSPDTLAPAFGTEINTEELRLLAEEFSLGDLSSLPPIEIRDRAELGGARGVYVLEKDKIYLAREFIESAASQEIVALLLEGIGHGIDARINTTDSAGDEGEIFSRLVRGEELSAAVLAALHQEDDIVELVIDGETLTGEANTLTVDTLTDVVDATDGVTSLREALRSAVSGDTITFAKSLSGGTITLGGSRLKITKSLTITGSGGGYLSVNGGILNLESLTITNSTVSGNWSGYSGGGISNLGTLIITKSTVSGNSAFVNGGGIFNLGTVTITDSTVSGNTAFFDGGGIKNTRGTLTIINSTVSGNSANAGGGIFNQTGRSSGSTSSTVSLESTIVADNIANHSAPDIRNGGSSTTVTASNSLIEDGTITNDLGNNITGQDPLLDPQGLQDNGGPTKTIALQRNSPAINAGSNPLGLTTDQRGEARTLGGGTDIGAYETPFVIVDTLTDVVDATDGVTSLREALVSAVSGDTITFANSLSGGTITLGGSQLKITKSLTIDGDINNDGVGDITIDGDGESRVLLVYDGNDDSRVATRQIMVAGFKTLVP